MFRVKCPICHGVLTIDTRTRRVVSHLTREQADEKPAARLDSLMEKVKKAKSEQESKLEAAKQREAGRKGRLEDLFKDAQKKAADSDEPDKPRGPVW